MFFYGAICPRAMQYDLLTGHEIPVKTPGILSGKNHLGKIAVLWFRNRIVLERDFTCYPLVNLYPAPLIE